jgi:paired amphipathic helix protein Sin3a
MLYARLLKMKELSEELKDKPPQVTSLNPVAAELGLQAESCKFFCSLSLAPTFTEKDRYTELLKNTISVISNEMDPTDYEDRARNMFGISAYLFFTIDKLLQTLAKQVIS